ncbi:MAG TPA: rhodanese-like domain-containing protein [Cyclobacteriaceae bacterium]|nr:rhodanese-like domain-containing protein [Cyclobacteriaceae bacterium]
MKPFAIFSLILLFSLTALAEENSILVTAQWVKDHQSDPNVVLVQINFLKLDYDAEHIAGARYLWPGSLAPDSPLGAMNEPDLKIAQDILEGMGISNDNHVVLYFVRNEVSPTSRIFLTLENLGMRGKVSVMDGGLEAWKKAGFPLTQEVPQARRGKFKPASLGYLVDKNYVLKNLNSNSTVIVDARMKRFYDGESTGNPRDGHIAGAKNIPYTDMVDQNNFFKPVDQLQGYFTPVADNRNKEIVTYCFIGQTASVVYLAGRILGYNMKLYDGSMQEWSRIKELPMEVTEKK